MSCGFHNRIFSLYLIPAIFISEVLTAGMCSLIAYPVFCIAIRLTGCGIRPNPGQLMLMGHGVLILYHAHGRADVLYTVVRCLTIYRKRVGFGGIISILACLGALMPFKEDIRA